jgi:hypothetical protein
VAIAADQGSRNIKLQAEGGVTHKVVGAEACVLVHILNNLTAAAAAAANRRQKVQPAALATSAVTGRKSAGTAYMADNSQYA